MIKDILKEDGNYVLIKLWANGKTNYRVQENKYGEEWDWSDYTDLNEATEEFDAIIAFVKEAEEQEKLQEEAREEAHGEEAKSHGEFLDKVSG